MSRPRPSAVLPAAGVRLPALRLRRPASSAAGWALLAAVSGAAIGAVSLVSLQLACTIVIAVLTGVAYVRSRAAGLVALWLVWLLAPAARRLFGLFGPFLSADPLALAPFLVTGLLVALEFRRGGMSRHATRLPLVATAGWLFGLPLGTQQPLAMTFALLAYISAVGAFLLGYHEPRREGTLIRVLLAATPLLAAYGVLQYFALPAWDRVWFETTGFVTATAPEADRVRIWGSLNSPATFAMVLTMALVGYMASRRIQATTLAGVALVATALALTYVRSAWVALAVAVVVLVMASRGRLAGRTAILVAILLVAVPALAAGTSTGAAVIGRFDTLGDLGSDTSANARQSTALALVPQAAAQPLGSGLGSAGEASRLADETTFRFTDNGYLSLLYQVGPVGFLLVVGAAAMAVRQAWHGARRRGSEPVDLAILGILVFLTAAMFTGDYFFGITGVAFWYLSGLAVRRGEQA